MPGRQAHGRPLLPSNAQPSRGSRISRSKSSAKALDAFTLATETGAPKRQWQQQGRTRDLGPEPPRKRSRFGHDDEEADSDGGAPEERPEKRTRNGEDEEVDSDFGSDSEGHEWRVGHGDEDDGSDIDSDEAFGEGDEERFEGYVFGGSRSKPAAKRREGSVDEEDGESLGEDAIDLADALDQASESGEGGSDSSSASGSDDDDDDAKPEASSDDSDDEDAVDASKLQALQGLASEFAELKEQDQDGPDKAQQGRAKISLSDLGLSAVKDRDIKKSLKLMSKEENATKPGSSRKLDVPLARRQQDRLVRIAASEKANETLDRWTDTVKHNRRAEHLMFPLPQSQADAGRDNSELMPITQKLAGGSELEQSIMAIMQESGLLPGTDGQGSKLQRDEDDQNGADSISRPDLKQLWSERRRERELHSREQARAKKIKKIKSKAWHRVHRKEKSRAEIAAAEGGGEPNSDEEVEAQDRKRATERVGARHRESKWAKMAAKTGRAAWDEEFREGLKDMVRKDEELRRRVEGRGGGQADDDDDDEDGADESDGSAGSENGQRRRLLKELERANIDVEEGPRSALMRMPFMQNAEKALKKANDELADQIWRDLRSDAGSSADEEEEVDEIGRRSYGLPKPHRTASASNGQEEMHDGDDSDADIQPVIEERIASGANPTLDITKIPTPSQPTHASSWSQKDEHGLSKRRKKTKTVKILEMDLDHDILRAAPQTQSKPKASKLQAGRDGRESPIGSDDEADDDNDNADDATGRSQRPFVLRDDELTRRAFAADDVVAEDFGREKDDIAAEDDEKVIDNTLPGWGSWVGEGVSAREQRRHAGRFLTRVEAVKQKDKRRDARLERVIISERRARRSERYLAGGLPHPFETREQYERSLRVPVGPEWMTKESFQDATKPRVIVKQGIIAPMAKPMI